MRVPQSTSETPSVTRLAAPMASIEPDAGERGSAEERAAQAANRLPMLEARLVWGRETLAVRHVRPRGAHGEVRLRDLALDLELPASPELLLGAKDESGTFLLRLPSGAVVPAGSRMTLRFGRASLRVSLVADDVARVPRARADARVAFGILAAAGLHLAMLAFVAHGRGVESASPLATEEAERATMQHMVAVAADRAVAELAAAQELTARERAAEPSAPALVATANTVVTTHARAASIAGVAGLAAATRTAPRTDTHAPNTASRAEAARFGVVAVVATGASSGSPVARAGSWLFAAEQALSARAAIFEPRIGETSGTGGLGLSGTGESGGGLGAGVSLEPGKG